MKCERLDGGPSVLPDVPAMRQQKKGVVVEGNLKPQAQGTGKEDEKKDRDPVSCVPFSILWQDVFHSESACLNPEKSRRRFGTPATI